MRCFGENSEMKSVIFEEETFSFFKSLLYKNGEAENMPEVARRLVMQLHSCLQGGSNMTSQFLYGNL